MLTLVGWWWGDGDLVRFLIITSSCWFCRLRFIISVAPAKITRSNKRAATTGKRRNILKIFSLPKQGVRIGVLINSHVSSNHSVLGTNSMLMIAAAPALLPPLCWKSKTGICGFDCNNLNWIKCLHYHLVSTSSGCWVLTKLVMTSMINHYEWLGFSQSRKKYCKFLCFSLNYNTVWKPWISTNIVQHEFWCEFGQFSY